MHPIFEVGIRPQITQGFHAPSTFASIFNKNNPNIGISISAQILRSPNWKHIFKPLSKAFNSATRTEQVL